MQHEFRVGEQYHDTGSYRKSEDQFLAYDGGYIPDELHVLDNPGVGSQFNEITSMMERVVIKFGGEAPELSVTTLNEETDFQRIVDHFHEPIKRSQEEGGTADVDVTPGRKFMSVIAFQVG